MNQMRTRLAALTLLDRSLAALDDDAVADIVAGLDDTHTEALDKVAPMGDDADRVAAIRTSAQRGRMNGGMEAVAAVLSDACLAQCVTELGDDAENPGEDRLREVLPTLVEVHGVGVVRVMMAAAVAGEAPASATLTRLLKTDEVVGLPPAEPFRGAPVLTRDDTPERAALRERRKAERQRKRADAAARREQQASARHRP